MCRILVLDDRENWRKLLMNALVFLEYQVSTALSTEEADALLQKNYKEGISFDLVISDVRLKDEVYDCTGIIWLKKVKASYSNIRTIILTGFPDEIQKHTALNVYGIDLYFEKVRDGKSLDIHDFSKQVSNLCLKN